jgi:beta-lactamase regulating signal transducer with metallopeptidase domain
MTPIRETVFDLLLNAILQIGLFAIVAATFSRFVARVKAKYQYFFYLSIFLFCLAAPIFNMLWQVHPSEEASPTQQLPSQSGLGNHHNGWGWQGYSKEHRQFTLGPGVQSWVIGLWGLLILHRLVQLCRGTHRAFRLRKDSSLLSPAKVAAASRVIGAGNRIALLESAAIDDPVTIGVFRPAILLPSKLLPRLGEQELLAIFAHEYAHIRRRDFLLLIVCEFLSIPMAWHPGIRYLTSRISQARELACDDYAAACLGKRRSYANTLLHLASLCLSIPRANATVLGIFDGDNLETRIMMLTEKRLSLSRAGVLALTLAASITFGASAVLAHAMTLQATSESSNAAEKFAGTWHWMFNGKSFATMILAPKGSSFTGSITPSGIALDENGELSRADATDDPPSPVAKSSLQGSALHLTLADGMEFTVTLKDDMHAEIHPGGAPPNMKPIPAEKVR